MSRPSFRQLEAALKGLVPGQQLAGGQPDDAYEALLWAVVVNEAARMPGVGQPAMVDHSGRQAGPLVFRRRPLPLQSKSQGWTHAVLPTRVRRPLEVHVGVQIEGASGVLHECDVLVVPSPPARAAVEYNLNLEYRHALLTVEGKFLSKGKLPLGHARTMVGLAQELDWHAHHALACTRQHGNAATVLGAYGMEAVEELTATASGNVVNEDALRLATRRAVAAFLRRPQNWL